MRCGQKAVCLPVIDIKSKKPVRQIFVENRVLSITPLSEQDILIGEMIEKHIGAERQPFAEFFPLSRAGQIQISSPVLGTDISIPIERDSQICAVYLFLYRYLMRQECISLRFCQNLVIPDVNSRQGRQMRC